MSLPGTLIALHLSSFPARTDVPSRVKDYMLPHSGRSSANRSPVRTYSVPATRPTAFSHPGAIRNPSSSTASLTWNSTTSHHIIDPPSIAELTSTISLSGGRRFCFYDILIRSRIYRSSVLLAKEKAPLHV